MRRLPGMATGIPNRLMPPNGGGHLQDDHATPQGDGGKGVRSKSGIAASNQAPHACGICIWGHATASVSLGPKTGVRHGNRCSYQAAGRRAVHGGRRLGCRRFPTCDGRAGARPDAAQERSVRGAAVRVAAHARRGRAETAQPESVACLHRRGSCAGWYTISPRCNPGTTEGMP